MNERLPRAAMARLSVTRRRRLPSRSTSALFLVLVLVCVGQADGAAYACRAADGSVEYSQFPCPQTSEQRVVSLPAAPADAGQEPEGVEEGADEGPVFTAAELVGRWTDFPDDRRFASVWRFTSTHLYFDRYNAPAVRKAYSVEDGVIIVHHEAGGLVDEAWDEEMEVVEFTGDTLRWRYGALVTLHRLP